MLSVFAPHLLVVPCQNKSSIKGGEVQKYVAYLDVWWASGWGGEVVHAMMHRRFYPLKSSHLDNLMRAATCGEKSGKAKRANLDRAPIVHQSLTVARSAIQFFCFWCKKCEIFVMNDKY